MGNMHLVTGYAGQAHVQAADVASFYAALLGTGEYVLNRGNQFSGLVVSNNQITISDGDLLMQGRHVRLAEGSTVDLNIENGQQGQIRHDLIVARYTKDSGTGVEDCNLVVIKGTATASSPSDPEYTSGDIINDHVILNDMPLYRVVVNGLNVQPLEQLFEVISLPKAADLTEALGTTTEALKIAQNANTVASAAMPKAGGEFTGDVAAYNTNRTTASLRNIEVRATSEEGELQSTNKIVMVRKTQVQ